MDLAKKYALKNTVCGEYMHMKVLIELTITGDFPDKLDDDEIEDILDKVIDDGCRSYYLTGKYVLKEIIKS